MALQKSRWAVKPHRAKLWENAEEVEGGPAGSALAVVLGGAIEPDCASGGEEKKKSNCSKHEKRK